MIYQIIGIGGNLAPDGSDLFGSFLLLAPGLFRPISPRTYSLVSLARLARNSVSLAKPPGTCFQEGASINFCIVDIGVACFVWTYPCTRIETRPLLSVCREQGFIATGAD